MAVTRLPIRKHPMYGNPDAAEWAAAHKAQTETVAEMKERLAAAGRACWDDLFRNVFTIDELDAWEYTIPSYGCDCKTEYYQWKHKNFPSFPIDLHWKYRLKSHVNALLGKPNATLQEVLAKYS